MKTNLIICCILFLTSCAKKSDISRDVFVELNKGTLGSEVFQYVSYVKQGDGSGSSPKNAADFLSETFWGKINELLDATPVRVFFAEGNYLRAYTEKPLTLNGVGSPKNQLILEGKPRNTIFSAPEGYNTKNIMVWLINSQNIRIRDFHFTGNGSINYVFRVTSSADKISKDILVENCQWEDMRGIVYGAAGTAQTGTSYITFKNCTFKRIGLNSGSHMIYNAYGASHVSVINSHFEDCTGDYVRFRDNMDYCVVKGSTFIKNQGFDGQVFIAVPLFNSREPVGDEYFCTNYSFNNNSFTNNASTHITNAITFYHSGFSPPEWNYLLTAAEGKILETGSIIAKKKLLLNNFGIDADKVRINGNSYSSQIVTKVALGTFSNYGTISKGFNGWGNITDLLNNSPEPFVWENEKM